MWWINRFGSVSGPYSDEQVVKGIKQLKFTKLHKISSDKQNWQRICDTEFWKPVSAAPEELEIPTSIGLKSAAAPITYGGDEQVALVTPPSTAKKSSVAGFLRLHKVGMVTSIGTIAASLLVSLLVFTVFYGKNDRKSLGPDFEAIKKKIVLIRGKDGGSGTGFLVKMDGKKYVMTNDHVARGAELPEMALVDGTKIVLGAMSTASDRDLVRFETDYNGDYFEFSDRIPNNNDEIWMYGNSMGDGVVTSLRGFVTGVGDRDMKVNVEIVPGNSGSPIVGRDGKVVAVAAYGRWDGNDRYDVRGTSFDGVRRFGIRPGGVSWIDIDKQEYERQSAKLEMTEVYCMFLSPYLMVEDTPEEELSKLKLEHKDIDKNAFPDDDAGFHEMLMVLSQSYAGIVKGLRRWIILDQERNAYIVKLKEAIADRKLALESGKKALDDWDRTHNAVATWENVKTTYRGFYSKRKEALLLVKDFLLSINWCSPLMRHGINNTWGRKRSVDWYVALIDESLAQNTQKLRDLNKELKTLERGEDDDEE